MNTAGCLNPGSHPDTPEPLATYSDLRSDAATLEVDWQANDFDRIAEQTLGAGL